MNQKQVSALQSKKTVFLYCRKIPVFAIGHNFSYLNNTVCIRKKWRITEIVYFLKETLVFQNKVLTLSWRRFIPYRNQFIDLLCKSRTGFYMICTSVMKKINGSHSISDIKLSWNTAALTFQPCFNQMK